MAEFVKQTEKPSFDDLMKKYKKQHRDIATSLKLHEYYMTPAEKKVLKRKEALKRK
jgi:ribosomal protein S21